MMRKLVILIAVLMFAAIITAPAAAQTNYVSYTVTQADANGGLSKIAAQFCTNWQTIYALNEKVIGPNPNIIVPGQVLTVPNNCPTPAPSGVYDRGPRTFANGTVNGNVYTPAAGDALSAIGVRFGVPFIEIARANRISDVNKIFPGQPLIIPGLNGAPSLPPPANQSVNYQPGQCTIQTSISFNGFNAPGGTFTVVVPPGTYAPTNMTTLNGAYWIGLPFPAGQTTFINPTSTNGMSATGNCLIVF